MKKVFFAFLLLMLVCLPWPAFSSHAQAAGNATLEPAIVRAEFEELFGEMGIYKAIRKYRPEVYEKFFQTYLAAKGGDGKEVDIAGFIAKVRNTYLGQSCDQSILDFFRYTAATGRDLYAKDPEAAFAYLFAGDPKAFEKYLDFAGEQAELGRLFEGMLATATPENAQALDHTEVDAGLDYVYVLLYYKHGKDFSLLTKSARSLDTDERRQLSAIYLDMYEEIFNLVPATRSNVLRSMAMKM